ncbi:protease inhibitor I42 family protein [Bacillus altitudinis]|uniref:protease inhibitor I42 family protein n=1 Tax=Bacillus altitudinis TaxID=293387 RepID=UPI00345B47E3
MYILTERDSGKQLMLGNGEVFFLALEENVSTGYHWVVDTSNLLVITLEEDFPGRPNVMGAPGLKLYRFMAKQTGDSVLVIKDRAPSGAAGEKEIHFKVRVD